MAITRWYPFGEVVAFENRVHSLFREINNGDGPAAAANFAPPVDIYEDAEKVVLTLEVPGVEEGDLDVRVENRTLTVKGERKFESPESDSKEPAVPGKEKNFLRIERRYGSFYRAFTLPTTVDTENVAAGYNAGVLKLELKKKPEAQPKQIKINVAA